MILAKLRHKKIVHRLLDSNKKVTVNQLPTIFDVSPRTIRRDLDKLEKLLVQKNINLIKKPGVGVFLESTTKNTFQLKQELELVKKEAKFINPKSRIRWLIKELLLGNQDLIIEDLEEQLYVSRTTVYNDLEEVKKWLKFYHLQLGKKNNRLFIKGREKNFRIATVNLLLELIDQNYLENIIESLTLGDSLITSDHELLNHFCFDLDLRFIKSFIESVEEKEGIIFTKFSTINLLLYLAVSFKRIKNKQEVILNKNILKEIKSKRSFKTSKLLAEKVEARLEIKLSKSEIAINLLQILAADLYQDDKLKSVGDIIEQVDSKLVATVKDLIYYWQYHLGIDLEKNLDFFKSLVIYFRSLYYAKIYQINYQDNYYNYPELSELKANYPYIFKIAKASFDILKDRLGIELKETEISAAGLMLLSVIEEQKKSIKAVVVLDSNLALAKLMKSRLERKIPRLEIVESYYFSQLNKLKDTKADLIISSRKIKNSNCYLDDIIVINPLVKSDDIRRIEDKLEIVFDFKTYFNSEQYEINFGDNA